MMNLRRINQAGDTIVEVLIAIAVVSLVLGGAYAGARQSLNTTRRTQERGEAVNLVQQQLERLKAGASNSALNIFNISVPFCLGIAGDNVNVMTDAADCNFGGIDSEDRYNITIERASDNTFTVSAKWDRFGGGAQEQINAVYRLHP